MHTAAISMVPGVEEADRADLADRLRRGAPGVFELLVSLYQRRVVRLAYRLMGWNADVDDVVQDVFLRALRNARGYRGEGSLWTWLTRITINCCRAHQRRRMILEKFRRALSRRRAAASPPSDCQAISNERARQVRTAVAALPSRDREVVVLFYLEQRPIAEIAALLNTSANAIEVRLHRARSKLRVALKPIIAD